MIILRSQSKLEVQDGLIGSKALKKNAVSITEGVLQASVSDWLC